MDLDRLISRVSIGFVGFVVFPVSAATVHVEGK